MSQYYIFATQLARFRSPRPVQQYELSLSDFVVADGALPPPGVGDQILVVSGKDGIYKSLEPHIYEIAKVKSKTLTLRLARSHVNVLPMDRVRSEINRALSDGGNALSLNEFEALVALLGAQRPAESRLLDHIKRYIAARGYYFDDETVHNYHICLKTRPFVILAGLSGTGKSKLTQLYAEAMGHTVQNEHYLRIAVRPSWNDDRFLLGYLNSITGEYVVEPSLEFVVRAEEDRDNLYFFCLDEMNLAHVEYYFSQFLSALEEENSADRRIHLFSRSTEQRLIQQGRKIDYGPVVIIPENLLFTGTINVDETTQPLSDKVIDRANTLEFFDVDLDKIPDRQPPPDPIPISASTWKSYVVQEPDSSYRDRVIEIGNILNQAGLGLGYRVLREIELYIANSSGLLEPDVAFDLQVKQRILPRVRGTASIGDMLSNLLTFMKRSDFPRSLARLQEMESRLKRDGYTSFWR
jgi:energy-coupling factor transporter ATP-binding protein EcfA2